ncbi:MAG TPA: hypothetical protein VFB62_01960, partial [Polyangiaceae bacterium]|nr:hypothetical protein [Polyangiaceae bacterium]
MTKIRTIPLDRIRTDGWFERLGESIGSFHTLCDVLGERFFAFALIAGARVSSLMIDRFNPDQSLVEFSFGGLEDPIGSGETERLTVVEFRQRLVATLMTKEADGPQAEDIGDDLEALQRHIGPRSLLLAPLYGYGLKELVLEAKASKLRIERGAGIELYDITAFRQRLLEHVREDLERGVQREGGTAIDLNNVDEAERAATAGNWERVIQLLGSWPMPLAIYWRTPEGQMLPEAARQRIAEGLGLLGTACAKLGDEVQGEEVLRLAVQYAQDGSAASKIFLRLGKMFLEGERWGEGIGPLRRAHVLGARPAEVLP